MDKTNSQTESPVYIKRAVRRYNIEEIGNSATYEPNYQFRNSVERVISNNPVSAFDVASYVLQKIGSCTTMKLHKLLYYCQAWSLVWDERPLFNENIEAWANGPVVREIFSYHRGLYEVSASDFQIGVPNNLCEGQKETVDSVLRFYGDKSSQWLINLTHSERPWISAREGLEPLERGSAVIRLDIIADYYSSL